MELALCNWSLTLMTENSLLMSVVLNPPYMTLHAEYLKAPYWDQFCLIYVNDLQYSMPNACLRLFADDTALVVNNSNIDTLIADVNHKLKMVHEWCTCNKLTINDTKTNFVSFQMKNKPAP